MFQKIFATFILALLFTGFTTKAQPVFSITTSPVDSMTLGQADPFTFIHPTSYLVNESAATLTLYWQLITDSTFYPGDWSFFGIADNFLVRAPSSGVFQHAVQLTAPIAPGDSSVMKLLVNVPVTSPNGGGGLYKIKVFDSLQTQVDTMVYRICKGVGCIFPAYRTGEGTGANNLDIDKAAVSLYPNPAAGRVYVRLRDVTLKPGDVTLMLYDYMGRLVLQQKLSASKEDINLRGYSPGVYLIKLYNKNKYLGGQKIIKQ